MSLHLHAMYVILSLCFRDISSILFFFFQCTSTVCVHQIIIIVIIIIIIIVIIIKCISMSNTSHHKFNQYICIEIETEQSGMKG